MGRTNRSALLNLYMNGEKVGNLSRSSSGKLELIYADEWIESDRSRSISLSLPVVRSVIPEMSLNTSLIISFLIACQ
jgi:serine/threonine-protein kinase HipA